MPRHYFHCTDGRDLVLDPRGVPLREDAPALQVACARHAAEALRAAAPGLDDWSAWQVCVVDEAGFQVAVVPFEGEPVLPAMAA